MHKNIFCFGKFIIFDVVKASRNIIGGLWVLCLLGVLGILLQTGLACMQSAEQKNICAIEQEHSEVVISSDLGVTRVLTPIISKYLETFLPRLVQ